MDRKKANEIVNSNLENYLLNKGIDINRNFKCLIKLHEHDYKNPAMSYDRLRNRVHCFKCGGDYDLIALIEAETGKTGVELFNYCYDYYNIQINNFISTNNTKEIKNNDAKKIKSDDTYRNNKFDYIHFFNMANANIYKTDYLTKRGISQETINKFKIGYVENWKHPNSDKMLPKNVIIIPSSSDTYIARNVSPNVDKSFKVMKVGNSLIYNLNALTNSNKRPVFVVEGEIDALSIITVGSEAVALGSVSNANKFIETCKSTPPVAPLILSLDNDVSGEEATNKIENGLENIGISYIKVNVSGNYKDPNEALVKNAEVFKDEVSQAEKLSRDLKLEKEKQELDEYQKSNVANYIQCFVNGISESVNTETISTGFDILDDVLDGGLYEGLYIIGAISSLGKTTFALQICDQIAAHEQDVLIFSLEMARTELMSKSISKITFMATLTEDKSNAKTARGITTGKRYLKYNSEEKELIKMAISDYAEYANHIYIHESMGDIGVDEINKIVEKHIKITGNKPIILIDYLQILKPYDMRATDKQNTDKSVFELKKISRQYKIPIIAISSLNREMEK